VELLVLRFLSVRPGQPSCRLLALPQEDLLKRLSGARNPSAGSLGGNSYIMAALLCFVCVWCVCGVMF